MVRSLGIRIDPEDSAPLYRQIADAIAGRIRDGALRPGVRLPPTRQLATELETHRNTVVRAFEELTAGGWVNSLVGRGTFVAEQTAPRFEPPPREDFPWSSLLSTTVLSEPLARFDRLAQNPPRGDAINLAKMQPGKDLLPHEMLRRCLDHVLRTYGARALGYSPRQGLPQLRALVADELQRGGVPASADDLLITTGSQQAIDLIARALINPGDVFLTEERTYSGAVSALTVAGARVRPVRCDSDGPMLDSLRARVGPTTKGLYVMPNSRNPTGAMMSRARREALVGWSRQNEVPIIEDDYGADLNLDGNPSPPALCALDANVFYVGTYSKKLIPALRVGFIVCPPPLRSTLVSLKHAMDLGTSALLQHALAEFLERGYMRTHLKRVVPIYRDRRDALVEALRAHLPEAVQWEVPERGVVLWLNLPQDVDSEAVFEEAKRQGVVVSPSTLYETGTTVHAGLRLTFCAEPPDRLREGARRLGVALHNVLQRRRRPSAAAGHQTLDLV
jgi:2-aminoadipate transaminase